MSFHLFCPFIISGNICVRAFEYNPYNTFNGPIRRGGHLDRGQLLKIEANGEPRAVVFYMGHSMGR
jgi:hypothetical protein